jgi:hypothetical protein
MRKRIARAGHDSVEKSEKKKKGFWAWISSTSTVSFVDMASSLYRLEKARKAMLDSIPKQKP